jgi:hypothetical protein
MYPLKRLRSISRRVRLVLWTVSFVAVLLGVAAIFLTSIILKERSHRFPVLATGLYRGSISGIDAKPLEFIVDRSESDTGISIAVLATGYSPTRALLVRATDETAMPVLFETHRGEYVLTGSKGSNGSYRGTVGNEGGLTFGTWNLQRIVPQDPSIDAESRAEMLPVWLSHRSVLGEIDSRRVVLEAETPARKQERDKLATFLRDSSTVRARARAKKKAIDAEIAALQSQLEGVQKKVRGTARSLQASDRVVPKGRLVNLARQSLERELECITLIDKQVGVEDKRSKGATS